MGREFLNIFTEWAQAYDSFTFGDDPQYSQVFHRYEDILTHIVTQSGQAVIEFGIGTGNLTKRLLEAHKFVFPVEPSKEMATIAQEKLGKNVTIYDGDLLCFPIPETEIDTIAHSYVFHHLNDDEKEKAIQLYHSILIPGGKIVYADTMFTSDDAYQTAIKSAEAAGFTHLSNDLKREYYPLIPTIRSLFEKNGFEVTFEQYNDFVWLVEAIKPSS